jgi:hypothetical protein
MRFCSATAFENLGSFKDPRNGKRIGAYPVRLTFLLPRTVLVFLGRHGFNTTVLPGNAVRIRGREAS